MFRRQRSAHHQKPLDSTVLIQHANPLYIQWHRASLWIPNYFVKPKVKANTSTIIRNGPNCAYMAYQLKNLPLKKTRNASFTISQLRIPYALTFIRFNAFATWEWQLSQKRLGNKDRKFWTWDGNALNNIIHKKISWSESHTCAYALDRRRSLREWLDPIIRCHLQEWRRL